MENVNGNAPGVSSLCAGELFDIELSKKDSSLGISVTVLFGKVFTLSLFCPFPLTSPSPHHSLCVAWFALLPFFNVDFLVGNTLRATFAFNPQPLSPPFLVLSSP